MLLINHFRVKNDRNRLIFQRNHPNTEINRDNIAYEINSTRFPQRRAT